MMRQTVALFARRRAGLPGARLLVLLAALAGLFAMHGMSDHGTMGHDSPETHGPATATAPTGAHAGPVAGAHDGAFESAGITTEVVTEAAGAVAIAAETVAAGDALDAGMHLAMGLCLAILAGAAVLALRRLRTWSYPLTRITRNAGKALLNTRARDPDPPDLHALSIQRC